MMISGICRLISLKNSVRQLPEIKQILSKTESGLLRELYEELDVLDDVYELIERSIVEEPPISVKEGGIIKLGYDPEIDTLKKATTEGKNWIIEVEAKEREATGIKGLKVGFNKDFGYFIEVTKSNLNLVPDRYIRKQTAPGYYQTEFYHLPPAAVNNSAIDFAL